MSIKFVPSPKNPTRINSRYEVRPLTPDHLPWVAAILGHSNMFHSPVWPFAYPEDRIKRMYKFITNGEYPIMHQINSGMSFGIFDLEYKYKRPESEATGGKLYWDTNDLDAAESKLVEQMDFPLCSVALAYDGINELESPKMMSLIETLPLFPTLYAELNAVDKRDPASWKPKGPKEVLMRNGTSTRADYEGEGLMKKLAQWQMRQAAINGFRGIQIECAHDAVNHVWMHAPEPFSSELIGKFDTSTYTQEDEEGKTTHPFGEGKQIVTQVFVTLVSFTQREFHFNHSRVWC
jgi:hypothetical protein